MNCLIGKERKFDETDGNQCREKGVFKDPNKLFRRISGKILCKMHKRQLTFLLYINEKSKSAKIVKKIQKNLDFLIPM